MDIQRQLLVPALVAGLLSAALSGCGGAGTQPGGPATSRATTNAQPAIPTTAYQVQGHVVSVLNGAKSVHVKGRYTWPHFRSMSSGCRWSWWMSMEYEQSFRRSAPAASWPVVITFEAGGGGGSAAVFRSE